MQKFISMMKESTAELKKVPVLTFCAMMTALAIVLNYVASINIGPYIRIGFSGLPNQIVDALFGPVTGGLIAAVLDIVKYFLKPDGPFYFGFTFNAVLAAFIYGCFYYKKKITFLRVLAAKAVVLPVVNIFFNTLFLAQIYGDSFSVLVPARALKNLIMWPIESAIFYILYKAIERTGIFAKLSHLKAGKPAQSKVA